MKWKVKFKYSYSVLYFVFESLEEAGEFVKTTLTHYVGDDDDGREVSLSIAPCTEKEEEEEEE